MQPRMSLIMIQISGNSSVLAKHKKNLSKNPLNLVETFLISIHDLKQTENSDFRKLLKLKFSRNSLCLNFHEKFEKAFEVIKKVNILMFEED